MLLSDHSIKHPIVPVVHTVEKCQHNLALILMQVAEKVSHATISVLNFDRPSSSLGTLQIA